MQQADSGPSGPVAQERLRYRYRFAIALNLLGLVLSGCAEAPSILEPATPAAERIADLWWIMFGLGTAIYVAVVGYLGYALYRAGRNQGDAENAEVRQAESEGADQVSRFTLRASPLNIVIFGGIVFPLVVLSLLFGLNLNVMAAINRDAADSHVVIDVIGHQWWWEVVYPEQRAVAQAFETANEIHLPAGGQATIRLTSEDVIHSFWVPEMGVKLDLIPGQVNSLTLEAGDETGFYYGECAEFCGLQHAHMKFVVVVVPPEAFDAWLAQQQQPAAEPEGELAAEGQALVLSSACVSCHTIRGTSAAGDIGPDLTHLASRLTLAAGTLPNTVGNLGGWISNPQQIKPGNLMPPTHYTGEELQAVLAYLESLE